MTKSTVRALSIIGGKLELLDLRMSGHGAHHTREIIGDTFCLAFNVPGESSGRSLAGYCDDNGLLKNLPVNIWMSTDLYAQVHPIVGPVVISAVNAAGNTVDMTDAEREAFTLVQHSTQRSGHATPENAPDTPMLRYKRPSR